MKSSRDAMKGGLLSISLLLPCASERRSPARSIDPAPDRLPRFVVWSYSGPPQAMTTTMIPRLALACAVSLCAWPVATPAPARADSAAAYCVLSQATGTAAPQQGPCRWSQRQGNVTITFQSREYAFPAEQEGKTYTRVNRQGQEAGPVFTKQGQYTLSVYWRKPAADAPGF